LSKTTLFEGKQNEFSRSQGGTVQPNPLAVAKSQSNAVVGACVPTANENKKAVLE
jgi:hypothetical protein